MEHATARPGGWLRTTDVDPAELRELADTPADPAAVPFAARLEGQVPVYAAAHLDLDDTDLLDEWRSVLDSGPGILVIEGAVDLDALDRATAAFEALIAAEAAAGQTAGDHFAAPGTNSRVWEALGKLAEHDPGVFVDYYESAAITAAARAWLGPWYQITSQVNVVRPGGRAQEPHRDYHLGFLTNDQAERFPAHVHRLSPSLTLQGAVAHVDMPVESGPTMYLPHSQRMLAGYLAWRVDAVRELFAERFVQLPLRRGDAVFFNPALLHGAGTNRTAAVQRMANLLQISSAFGRTMETVDRARLCTAIYPALVQRVADGWSTARVERVIAAAAHGYPFPANLDRTPPVDGLAPPSQADVLRRALTEEWDAVRFTKALSEYEHGREADPGAPQLT